MPLTGKHMEGNFVQNLQPGFVDKTCYFRGEWAAGCMWQKPVYWPVVQRTLTDDFLHKTPEWIEKCLAIYFIFMRAFDNWC